MSADVPVRVCCGLRHRGSVCPDGKVVCCLCFERVPVERLSVTVAGGRTDVCDDCAAGERGDR